MSSDIDLELKDNDGFHVLIKKRVIKYLPDLMYDEMSTYKSHRYSISRVNENVNLRDTSVGGSRMVLTIDHMPKSWVYKACKKFITGEEKLPVGNFKSAYTLHNIRAILYSLSITIKEDGSIKRVMYNIPEGKKRTKFLTVSSAEQLSMVMENTYDAMHRCRKILNDERNNHTRHVNYSDHAEVVHTAKAVVFYNNGTYYALTGHPSDVFKRMGMVLDEDSSRYMVPFTKKKTR